MDDPHTSQQAALLDPASSSLRRDRTRKHGRAEDRLARIVPVHYVRGIFMTKLLLILGLCVSSQLVGAAESATIKSDGVADLHRHLGAESTTIRAASVTGWNRYLGEPRYRWDFLPAPLYLAGANTVAEYNPNGVEPLPLTPASSLDTVLASVADPYLEID